MEKNQVAKIAITSDADVALVQALDSVNQGNSGGRVTKVELASWLILKAAVAMNTQNIDEIRKAHFNQSIYLENLLRTLKQSGRNALSFDEIENLQSILKQKLIHPKKTTKPSTEKEGVAQIKKIL